MKNLVDKLSFDDETKDVIFTVYDKINNSEYKSEFENGVMLSLNDIEFALADYMTELAKKIDENIYSLYLVHFLACAIAVKPEYEKRGISDEVYYDTVDDLTYKIAECKRVYGVLGIVPYTWYRRIFRLEIFKLGRLEYGTGKVAEEPYGDYIKAGDAICDLHIPSAGPLTYDMVIDSLKRAYKFFKCKKYLFVDCRTWLLYPPYYREVFTEGSNMRMFYEQFDIVSEHEQPNWAPIYQWVFGEQTDVVPLNELPAKTRLQQNIIKYYNEGKTPGVGHGIIVFDGEKIVNKTV